MPPDAARRAKPCSLQLKAGLVIIGAIVLLGLLAPWIAPHPWDTISIRTRFLAAERDLLVRHRRIRPRRAEPAADRGAPLARDGGRRDAVSLAIGVPIGLLAGYFRGWVDEVLMRGADVLMAVPPIMLGLLVLAVTPPALWKTALAVGFVYIPLIARLARSVTLSLANEDFIQAAQARAESTGYILFREILPNAWPPLIVEASLRVTYAILLGSALSFLGLGAQPPSSDWGLMIAEARPFLDRAPWIALAPGIAMCLLVIGINLLGDGAARAARPAAQVARRERLMLTIDDLTVRYRTPGGAIEALTDVSLSLARGSTLALVGESGSGKSTVALAAMGLLPAEANIASGRILFERDDILKMSPAARRSMRGSRMSLVFQDPFSVLNPSLRIGEQVGEALVHHRGHTRAAGARACHRAARRGRHRRSRHRGAVLSARAFRRHAPARADRRRSGRRARAPDPRRADDRARRHDRGADPRPARSTARQARPHHAVHQPQSRAWCGESPTTSRCSMRARSSNKGARRTCCTRRCILIPRACWLRSRGLDKRRARSQRFQAGCPIFAPRRWAAGSSPAARSPQRTAPHRKR